MLCTWAIVVKIGPVDRYCNALTGFTQPDERAGEHGQQCMNMSLTCRGNQHVVKVLAEKVVCWVDSGGPRCISWASGSGPIPLEAFWIPCVQLVQCLVKWWQ